MVNISTNINKTNNYLAPLIIEHIIDHSIWRWKSSVSWFETSTDMWRSWTFFREKLLLKHLQGYKRRCFTLNSRGSRWTTGLKFLLVNKCLNPFELILVHVNTSNRCNNTFVSFTRNTTGVISGAGTACPSEAHEFIPGFSAVPVARSLLFSVVFCRSLFVLMSVFLFTIVLFAHLQFTDTDYLFGIFKLFFIRRFLSHLVTNVL